MKAGPGLLRGLVRATLRDIRESQPVILVKDVLRWDHTARRRFGEIRDEMRYNQSVVCISLMRSRCFIPGESRDLSQEHLSASMPPSRRASRELRG